jgi:hypothetical protein
MLLKDMKSRFMGTVRNKTAVTTMKTSILTMSKEGQTDSNKCKTVISV